MDYENRRPARRGYFAMTLVREGDASKFEMKLFRWLRQAHSLPASRVSSLMQSRARSPRHRLIIDPGRVRNLWVS